MSDMDPNFEDDDSCYDDEDEPSCDYGDEFCEIMLAQNELDKARQHRVAFHLRRLFSKAFRAWLDDIYATIGLSGTESCSFLCPLRGQWQNSPNNHDERSRNHQNGNE